MAKSKRDPWKELCKRVEADDGLPTREANSWTVDKLSWWYDYVHITTTAMVGKPAWRGGVAYVDLFAGPGICTVKESRRRIPGSPLIAACAPKPFSRILLCELDEESAAACESRLSTFGAADRATVFRGDSNKRIRDIAREIPQDALTIACIDPTGLHARFETIAELTRGRPVDLMMLVADRIDIVRNLDQYRDQQDSKLDHFLGDVDWRSELAALQTHSAAAICGLFAAIYKRQLQNKLGYDHVHDRVLRFSHGAPIYRLFYASKHPRGSEFWLKITKKDRRGPQLFGDDA